MGRFHVVTRWSMPIKVGWVKSSTLRCRRLDRGEDPDVTAVVSSGYSHEPVVADFRKYGFKGALPKPYSVETLERELAALLR